MQGRAFLILLFSFIKLVVATSPPLVGPLLRRAPTPTASPTPVTPTVTPTLTPDPFAHVPTATPAGRMPGLVIPSLPAITPFSPTGQFCLRLKGSESYGRL